MIKSALGSAQDSTMYAFASGVSTAMLSGIGVAIGIMVLMTGSALFYRSAMGGKKDLWGCWEMKASDAGNLER